MKQHRRILSLALVSMILVCTSLLLTLVSCTNVDNTPANTPLYDTGNAQKGPSGNNNRDSNPSPSVTPSETPYKALTIWEIINEKQEAGEISGCYCGETRHLVYKWIEATFDKEGYYVVGILDSEGNYILPLRDLESAGELKEFLYSYTSYLGTSHIGYLEENVFVVATEHWFNLFNADELTSSHIEMKTENGMGYVLSEIEDSLILENGFHDGVVVTYRTYQYDRYLDHHERQAVIIDKNGNITYIDAFMRPNDWWFESSDDNPAKGNMNVGIYRDGLLWAFGGFYDIEGNLVIDLSDYKITNIPQFRGGICQLTIKKNGKLWSVEIDKSGEFLSDPVSVSD